VAVPVQVYELAGSSFSVGMLGLVGLVPLVAFGLWGGAVADADDRRLLLGSSLTLWATGQPLLLEAATVAAEIARLRNLQTGHIRAQRRIHQDIDKLLGDADRSEERAGALKAIAEHAAARSLGGQRWLGRARSWPDRGRGRSRPSCAGDPAGSTSGRARNPPRAPVRRPGRPSRRRRRSLKERAEQEPA
jgi:hypothetical protein